MNKRDIHDAIGQIKTPGDLVEQTRQKMAAEQAKLAHKKKFDGKRIIAFSVPAVALAAACVAFALFSSVGNAAYNVQFEALSGVAFQQPPRLGQSGEQTLSGQEFEELTGIPAAPQTLPRGYVLQNDSAFARQDGDSAHTAIYYRANYISGDGKSASLEISLNAPELPGGMSKTPNSKAGGQRFSAAYNTDARLAYAYYETKGNKPEFESEVFHVLYTFKNVDERQAREILRDVFSR